VVSYARTVRGRAVDFAAKVVSTGREIILKVTQVVMEHLRFDQVWERGQNPVLIMA
jgi:hypothetical protein